MGAWATFQPAAGGGTCWVALSQAGEAEHWARSLRQAGRTQQQPGRPGVCPNGLSPGTGALREGELSPESRAAPGPPAEKGAAEGRNPGPHQPPPAPSQEARLPPCWPKTGKQRLEANGRPARRGQEAGPPITGGQPAKQGAGSQPGTAAADPAQGPRSRSQRQPLPWRAALSAQVCGPPETLPPGAPSPPPPPPPCSWKTPRPQSPSPPPPPPPLSGPAAAQDRALRHQLPGGPRAEAEVRRRLRWGRPCQRLPGAPTDRHSPPAALRSHGARRRGAAAGAPLLQPERGRGQQRPLRPREGQGKPAGGQDHGAACRGTAAGQGGSSQGAQPEAPPRLEEPAQRGRPGCAASGLACCGSLAPELLRPGRGLAANYLQGDQGAAAGKSARPPVPRRALEAGPEAAEVSPARRALAPPATSSSQEGGWQPSRVWSRGVASRAACPGGWRRLPAKASARLLERASLPEPGRLRPPLGVHSGAFWGKAPSSVAQADSRPRRGSPGRCVSLRALVPKPPRDAVHTRRRQSREGQRSQAAAAAAAAAAAGRRGRGPPSATGCHLPLLRGEEPGAG
ncbi:basic proline-rich protein-like [Hemicordylus capensis]|uniref:basic proline-rich protein-like n=1 Tax=Hemicordylus capensis TaxID=884348 RepID=UPI00230268AE|nr:basic proline-rich protein-like [Hemicordylus capensis]